MNPICMGERMQGSGVEFFLNLREIGERVYVMYADYWFWEIKNIRSKSTVKSGVVTKGGKQAAANAATRWLLDRAEKTRILASRRAA